MPAAAKGRFDDQREANFFCDPQRLSPLGHGILCAGKHGDMELLGEGAGGGFVAHVFEQLHIRPDENNSRPLAPSPKS